MADDHLLDVASKIVDNIKIDWAQVELQTSGHQDRAVLKSLRVLADIANVSNPSSQWVNNPVQALAGPTNWGHLRILEELGRGGFGTVFRAWDATLEREVALKLVHSTVLPEGVSVSGLLREGRQLARVRHPNVVTVHGADARDGRFGLWMELIRGYTLRELLDAQGPFSAREAAAIVMDLCRALAAVHYASLVHGDIKATNVMREDGGRVVLMDFGAVRRITVGRGRVESVQGTPLYLAPEVLDGGNASVAADIYSLGVLLYQLVSGKYPITASSRAELLIAHQRGRRARLIDVRPDLPPVFVDVVERCLSTDPEARYQTAGELGVALALATGTPFQPERPRTRWVAIAAAAAVAVVVVGTASLSWRRAGTPDIGGSSSNAVAIARDVSFRIGATFYAVKAGAPSRLSGGSRIEPGEQLFLTVEASRPVFVYVINRDDAGQAFLLFPLPGMELQNPVPMGVVQRLPGSIGSEDHNWRVSSVGGREHFFVYVSAERLTDFESVLAALPRAELGRPVSNLPLSLSAMDVLRGVGGLAPAAIDSSVRENALFADLPLLPATAEIANGVWARRITFENPTAAK